MVSFFWWTCCGCLVASSWDIFLCILSSLHASMLGLGGFEFDVLGIGFIITGLDNFDLERWTATSTASAPEGSSKDSTALISIQGLWICDIYFLRELETRCWLKYAVHVRDRLYQTTTSTASTPEGSSKDSTALISIQGEYLGIRIETFNCLMEEKEVTSLQMVDQATQNRNLRTPYRSGACYNETQSTVNQSLWYQDTK